MLGADQKRRQRAIAVEVFFRANHTTRWLALGRLGNASWRVCGRGTPVPETMDGEIHIAIGGDKRFRDTREDRVVDVT